MDRVNGANTVDIGGSRRGFRSEDLVNGLVGTEVTSLFMNSMQEEIMKVIEEAGLVPDDGDWTQLWQALKVFGLAGGSRARRWMAVISMTTTAPPGAPADGDAYLVPAAASGAWAAHVGEIAEWTGSSWSYMTPPDGHGIALSDGRVFERIAGVYVEKLALDSQSGKWRYAVASGSANTLTLALDPAPATYAAGLSIIVQLTATNTAAMTINVNGLGAKSILRADGKQLAPGDGESGALLQLDYDGSAFRVARALASDIRIGALLPQTIVKKTTVGAWSWVVPDGVYSVLIRLWGGGGGGGYSSNNGAASGGTAGAYAERRFLVNPGDVVSGVVGAGGAGGAASPAQPGQPGLDTSVTVNGITVFAGGGPGGLNAGTLGAVANSPAASSYSAADFGVQGGRGFYGVVGYGPIAYGGNGGASPLGGVAAMGGSGAASSGSVPGGGGSASGNGAFAGGVGARGEAHIIYSVP